MTDELTRLRTNGATSTPATSFALANLRRSGDSRDPASTASGGHRPWLFWSAPGCKGRGYCLQPLATLTTIRLTTDKQKGLAIRERAVCSCLTATHVAEGKLTLSDSTDLRDGIDRRIPGTHRQSLVYAIRWLQRDGRAQRHGAHAHNPQASRSPRKGLEPCPECATAGQAPVDDPGQLRPLRGSCITSRVSKYCSVHLRRSSLSFTARSRRPRSAAQAIDALLKRPPWTASWLCAAPCVPRPAVGLT